MDSDPLDASERFERYAEDALGSLPSDLRARMSNLESWSKTNRHPVSDCSASIRACNPTKQVLRRRAAGPDHDLSWAAPVALPA